VSGQQVRSEDWTVISLGFAAAASMVAISAAIHLDLWATGYKTIPSIGPLFLFQGVIGATLAVLLVLSRRMWAIVTCAMFTIATISGFLLSVYVGLFGFMDTFAAPFAALSLAAEGVGTVLLSLFGAVVLRSRPRSARVSAQDYGRDCWQ